MKKKKLRMRALLTALMGLSACLNTFGENYKDLWVGETYKCDATSATNSSPTDISWSSSGGNITLSGSGLYRNVKATKYWDGTATVTCSWRYTLYYGGPQQKGSMTWKFTCRENSVSIYPTEMRLTVGDKGQLYYSHAFSNSYTSAANAFFNCNSNVVSVTRKGEVTALKPGTAYVNVYSNLSSSAKAPYCTVTVVEAVKPTSVSFEKSQIKLTKNYYTDLQPILSPSEARASFEWSSSNEDVAVMHIPGKVRGMGKGRSTITVTTDNGKSATCEVEVVEPSTMTNANRTQGIIDELEVLARKTLNYIK